MLTIDVKISCIVVLITPLSLFVASFITKKTYSMFQLQTSTRGEQTALIDEIVGNEKVVQAFNHEDEALEQFDEINDRLQKCSLRATFFSSLTNPSTRFVNSLVYAGVGIFGAMSALTGGITVGQLHASYHMPTSTPSRSTRYQVSSQSFRTHLPVLRVFLSY